MESRQLLAAQPFEPDLFTGEVEPNDPGLAANVLPLGFGNEQARRISVSGDFFAVDQLLAPAEENGSRATATPLLLDVDTTIQVTGFLGDGVYGQTSGDYDFYRLAGMTPGTNVTIDIDAVRDPFQSELDAFVTLIDNSGNVIASSDNSSAGLDPDSFIITPLIGGGTYYIIVHASGTSLPSDLNDPSTGSGAETTGPYRVNITREHQPLTSDVDQFQVRLDAGDVLGVALTPNNFQQDSFYGIDISGPNQTSVTTEGSLPYPDQAPFPRGLVTTAIVADVAGDYVVSAFGNGSFYQLDLSLDRPGTERLAGGKKQAIYLDFDGTSFLQSDFAPPDSNATGVIEIGSMADSVSRLASENGLSIADGYNRAIDEIIGVVLENLDDAFIAEINGDYDATRIWGEFGYELLNSRDHPDRRFDEDMSVIAIGSPLNISINSGFGLSEPTQDVGNFDLSDQAIVDSHRIASASPVYQFPTTDPLLTYATIVGNEVSHRIGHFVGTPDTNTAFGHNRLMNVDTHLGLFELAGVGPDLVPQTDDDIDVDFGRDTFSFETNSFDTGSIDSLSDIAWGFSTGQRIAPTPDVFYFAARTPDGQRELYISDGTGPGTRLRHDLSGDLSSGPGDFVVTGSTLYFTAQTTLQRRDVYFTFAGAEEPFPIGAIAISENPNPRDLITIDDWLYFTQRDLLGERHIYRAKAFPTPTLERLFDPHPGYNTQPSNLINVDGKLFFVATTPDGQRELHGHDPSTLSTELIRDVSGGTSSSPRFLTDADGLLLYAGKLPSGESELMVSDGTSSGTRLLKNLAGGRTSNPREMTPLVDLGLIVFAANTDEGERELFVSDGTMAGTKLLVNLSDGLSSSPKDLTLVGNRIFFTARVARNQRELYVTDGTVEGTGLVRDISGSRSSSPTNLTAVGDEVFFRAILPDGRRELFRSDGTAAGTRSIKTPHDDKSISTGPTQLQSINGRLYFAATTIDRQRELHYVDPGANRYVLLKDVAGSVSGNPGRAQRAFFTFLFSGEGTIPLFAPDADISVASEELTSSAMVYDVNQDGSTTARDALMVINHLSHEPGESEEEGRLAFDRWLDVNGDQQVTARDALAIVNQLSRETTLSLVPFDEEDDREWALAHDEAIRLF